MYSIYIDGEKACLNTISWMSQQDLMSSMAASWLLMCDTK